MALCPPWALCPVLLRHCPLKAQCSLKVLCPLKVLFSLGVILKGKVLHAMTLLSKAYGLPYLGLTPNKKQFHEKNVAALVP